MKLGSGKVPLADEAGSGLKPCEESECPPMATVTDEVIDDMEHATDEESPAPAPKKKTKAASPKDKADSKASGKAGKSGKAGPKASAKDSPAPARPKKVEKTFGDYTEILIKQTCYELKQAQDPTRMGLLLLLDSESESNLCVGDLCERLSANQPSISHHLALLRAGRVVVARRDGKNNFYQLTAIGRAVIKGWKIVHEELAKLNLE